MEIGQEYKDAQFHCSLLFLFKRYSQTKQSDSFGGILEYDLRFKGVFLVKQ